MYFGGIASYAYLTKQAIEGVKLPMNKYLMGAPVFAAGFLAGAFLVGESNEFFHLIKKYPTYRKEFKMIKNELYFS